MSTSSDRLDAVAAMINDNAITSDSTPEAERVSGAALIGLWLLIPMALGAVSYAMLGITALLTAPTGDLAVGTDQIGLDWRWWIGLTIALQVVYWLLIAPRPITCLWALIPVVALIPTYFIARDVLLGGQSGRRVRPPAQDAFDAAGGRAIWIEPAE